MGSEALERFSVAQLERLIRQRAAQGNAIIFTAHASQRMRARKVIRSEVLECLRCGRIPIAPEPNRIKASLEVRMQYYIAGREVKVVVALQDEHADTLVVTVIA